MMKSIWVDFETFSLGSGNVNLSTYSDVHITCYHLEGFVSVLLTISVSVNSNYYYQMRIVFVCHFVSASFC